MGPACRNEVMRGITRSPLARLGRFLAARSLAAFDGPGRHAGACCVAGPGGMAALSDRKPPGSEPMTGTTAETAIHALVQRWAQALRDRDAAAILQDCAPGRLAYTLAPPLVSHSADKAGLQAWFDTWQGSLGCELRDLDVTAAGDLGFCHGLVHLSGTKTDGTTADLWFRQTLCFRRLDGAWKVVHQHQSVPFHMDGSFRAAVDLAP